MTSAEYQQQYGSGKGKQAPVLPPSRPTQTSPALSVGIEDTEPTTDPLSTFVFFGVIPGNNGPGGLLRMHWRKKSQLLNHYLLQVISMRRRRHSGPVRLELTRYSTGRPMDYDNLVSTGKLLIDALVRAGVLPDDNPKVIAERVYTQERAEGKAYQRTTICLTSLSQQ